MTEVVLRKCWKNILIESPEFDDDDDIPLSDLRNREDVHLMRNTISLVNSIFPEVRFHRHAQFFIKEINLFRQTLA